MNVSKPSGKDRSAVLPSIVTSSFVTSVLLLVGLDCFLSQTHPLTRAPIANLERSEPFLDRAAFLALPDRPDIVLLGSSVIIAPVLQSDSLKLNRRLSRMQYRDSQVMSAALHANGFKRSRVFSFAVNGCMFSDAYLITKNVLCSRETERLKPRAIMFFVAPRDIQDNIMQQAGIGGTESFLCLASVSDALHVQSTSQMDAWRRLDLAAGRVSALWRSRKELTTLANLRMKRVLERLLPWVAFEKKTQDGSTKVMKGGEFVEEARGEPTVNPGIELGHLSWSDTEREYQLRYNPLSPKMNKLQVGYLAQLIKLCDDEGIHLIVVNMPLSRRNKSSMPLDFYTTFKNQVSQLCRRSNHADFVDLASCRFDADENFADGVHLRCDCSQPFIDFLAQELTKTRLSEMLGSSANSGLFQSERRLPAE